VVRGSIAAGSGLAISSLITARFDLLDLEVMMKRGGCGFVPDDRLLVSGETPAYCELASTEHWSCTTSASTFGRSGSSGTCQPHRM
jgi:hypothetical protein